jgi:hypothetical protein
MCGVLIFNITPWSRILLEKLKVAQLDKEFPALPNSLLPHFCPP